MIKLEKVSKVFGNTKAIDDVTLEIADGEFLFITGPSGSGKTTLIRLLMREYISDKGKILVDNKNIADLNKKDIPSYRQKLGVVFQDFKILPERTVEENVNLALAVVGVDEAEWEKRLTEALEMVGLKDKRNLFPSQLSGGELQKVAMARAVVVNPKIILADEPTGNLDWDTAKVIIQIFEKINKTGKTMIVASHHRGIIDKMDKRVVEIKEGKIISDSKKKQHK